MSLSWNGDKAPPVVKAVAFDLDGLMLNTEDIFHIAGNELLRRRGCVMTPELRTRMMGRRPHDAFAVLVETLELPDPIDDLLAESQQIFLGLLPDHVAPMPGLFELLQCVESSGLRKGVATSSPRHYLEDMLGRFDLQQRFEMTLAAEDVVHGKPHPEIYLTAAERLGVAPAELLVLEDSEAGSRAAVAAGAVTVAVPNDHTRSHDFSRVAYVAESLHDPAVLGLFNGRPIA